MKRMRFIVTSAIFTLVVFLCACDESSSPAAQRHTGKTVADAAEKPPLTQIASPQIKKMLENARRQIGVTKSYNPEYVVISYPNGDISEEKGVCSDVVVRAMRAAGVDLQKELHEDMTANFAAYPQKWQLTTPDANIDHRRVPNLQTFFKRRGKEIAATRSGTDYAPGDVVAWDLNGRGLTHIGVVSNLWNEATGRYSIIHNIGAGAAAEDCLFDWKIIGHYRYF